MSKLTTLLVAAMLVFATATAAVAQATEHCPEKNHPSKVESAEDAGSLVFDAGVEFCAKKKTGNTGVLVADGETTLYQYLVQANIDGEPGEGPSYYIVYSTPPPDNGEDPVEEPPVEEPEEPTEEPAEEPVEEPREGPSETPAEEPQEQPAEQPVDDNTATDEPVEREAPAATPEPVERDELAYTGATEFLLVVLGLALLAAGWYTVRRATG